MHGAMEPKGSLGGAWRQQALAVLPLQPVAWHQGHWKVASSQRGLGDSKQLGVDFLLERAGPPWPSRVWQGKETNRRKGTLESCRPTGDTRARVMEDAGPDTCREASGAVDCSCRLLGFLGLGSASLRCPVSSQAPSRAGTSLSTRSPVLLT